MKLAHGLLWRKRLRCIDAFWRGRLIGRLLLDGARSIQERGAFRHNVARLLIDHNGVTVEAAATYACGQIRGSCPEADH